jgi:hypothetical protein
MMAALSTSVALSLCCLERGETRHFLSLLVSLAWSCKFCLCVTAMSVFFFLPLEVCRASCFALNLPSPPPTPPPYFLLSPLGVVAVQP